MDNSRRRKEHKTNSALGSDSEQENFEHLTYEGKSYSGETQWELKNVFQGKNKILLESPGANQSWGKGGVAGLE